MPVLKFLLLSILAPVWTVANSQTKTIICGVVTSSDSFNVNIYEPIYGHYNLPFVDSSSQNSAIIPGQRDSIHKVVNVSSPSFVYVYFRDEKGNFLDRSDLLLFPGDSIHLQVNLDSINAHSVVYSGDNWAGQKLFKTINYEPYNKFIPVFDILAKLPANKSTFVKEMEDSTHLSTRQFDLLAQKGLVTEAFADRMNRCLTAILFDQVVGKLLQNSTKRNLLNKDDIVNIISELFTIQPATDSLLKGMYLSDFYLADYYNFITYKSTGVNSIDELKDHPGVYMVNNREYTIDGAFIPFSYIGDKTDQMDLWALWILIYFSYPGKYDFSIAEQYDSIFGSNKWSSLFSRQYKGAGLAATIEYKLQSPIHYMDMTNTSRLSNLLNKLPQNQPVFIDMWATWCYPCIAAFGFNTRIDSFLISQNISRLYIGFDNEGDYPKWKQGIEKYALGGYHILANKKLKRDIAKEIYHISGNEGMGIPRYALAYNGKIIADDFTSPARTEEFFKQMQAAISSLKKTTD